MDNNNKKNTNVIAILGLVFSFFISIVGLILSIIALQQIKKTQEEGRGLAVAGIIISVIKLAVIIVLTIVSVLFTTIVWGSLKESIMENAKCVDAIKCEYDEINDKYNCIYIDEGGFEEDIVCDEDSISTYEKKSALHSSYKYSDEY